MSLNPFLDRVPDELKKKRELGPDEWSAYQALAVAVSATQREASSYQLAQLFDFEGKASDEQLVFVEKILGFYVSGSDGVSCLREGRYGPHFAVVQTHRGKLRIALYLPGELGDALEQAHHWHNTTPKAHTVIYQGETEGEDSGILWDNGTITEVKVEEA